MSASGASASIKNGSSNNVGPIFLPETKSNFVPVTATLSPVVVTSSFVWATKLALICSVCSSIALLGVPVKL